ncbi:MAG: hypothetical protein SPH79_07730, partial [Schaalia hyovaginalis]|nr:hypothetical protein [Schaalia hyovaginalis]
MTPQIARSRIGKRSTRRPTAREGRREGDHGRARAVRSLPPVQGVALVSGHHLGARQIRTASFVAVLIDARAIREEGLPVADYFLWNDDFEYTARLLRTR